MNYRELVFTVQPDEEYYQDLLIAALGEINYDTFEETENGFKAYIISSDFNEELLEVTLASYKNQFSFSYEVNVIEQKNWNEVWESNFEPIFINDEIYVRATFHEERPEFKYEIVIDPKMAFGTGHHETTAMVMEWLLETDLKDKTVLDMGSGTGILAILASKLGAKTLLAIDNDEVCYESAIENAALNGIVNIKALCGSKEIIPDEQYDVILANINRNILLDQLHRYAEVMVLNGELFLSGFYETPDLAMIEEEANKYGLQYVNHKKAGLWVSAKFIKNK
jgi:ribosomal protein L11 methyltransferase